MDCAPSRRRRRPIAVEPLEARVLLTVGELVRQGAFEGTSANVAVDWIKGSAWQAGQLGHTNYHGGTGYAYNGTSGGSYIHNTSGAAGEMYEELTIPAGTVNPTLTFWTKITTEETTTTTAYDTMAVQVRSTAGTVLSTLVTLSNLNAGSTSGPYTSSGKYTLRTFSLSAYVGQTIRLYFKVTTDGTKGTMFRVDDVSLAPPGATVTGTSQQVVAYIPDYRSAQFSKMDLGLVSHVNYFSITFDDATGAVTQPSTSFNSRLDSMVTSAHAKGAGVSITVGPKSFNTMAANATSRGKFVADINTYILAHNLDGVDIDWESPATGINQVNYGILIDDLYAALAIGKKITAAVNPWTKEIPVDATKKMSWVNVMCYDFDTDDHSNYAQSTDGMWQWFYYGVAKDKLTMGVPFYGRYGTTWTNPPPAGEVYTHSKSYGEIPTAAVDRILPNYLALNGSYPAPTVDSYTDENGHATYFNGVRTMQLKQAFVRDQGFAGTMIWELGHDHWDASSKYDKYSLLPVVGSMIRPPAWLTTTAGSLHDLVNGQFIASLGTMTLNADTFAANPKLDVTINSGAALVLGATNHIGSITIDTGGSFDLKDKKLIIDWTGSSPIGAWNGTAYSGVLGMINSGAIKTTMTGTDIVVGVAEASTVISFGGASTATWQGQTVDSTSVLVRRTYNGDADLDGTVDGDDFFAIDSHYGQPASSLRWNYGDFDRNGRIDADDYFILDSVYMHNHAALVAAVVTEAPAGAELPSRSIFADDPDVGDGYDVLSVL